VRELDIMLHIRRLSSDHPGVKNISTLLDHFHIRRNDKLYLCLVFNVLGPSLAKQVPDSKKKLDIDWIKEQLYRLLQALDFLHTEAHIVHGGEFTNPIHRWTWPGV
jgi:serine/threonine protein kinase